MAREISLTRGLLAIVDDQDFDFLSTWKWHAKASGDGSFFYAARSSSRSSDRPRRYILLHRVLLDAPPGVLVDHVNLNTLDDRRSNLRLCSKAENCRNGRPRGSKSGFKGVTWYPRYGRWVAAICVDYRVKTLGYFDDKVLAAQAYDVAARSHFGEFARVNFQEEA